jgi:hypothetical protein
MRFYKEVWGFIFEFNSLKEYIDFLIGRFWGYVVLGIIFYFLFLR